MSKTTPAARKAEIRRLLAALCPTPLSDDDLERAARFVEENSDQDAAWIAGVLLTKNREIKICRGLK